MTRILLHAVIVWVAASVVLACFLGGMLSAFKAPRKARS
jgi:hypothetical protein